MNERGTAHAFINYITVNHGGKKRGLDPAEMRNKMKQSIILLVAFASLTVFAAPKTPSIYLVNGNQVDAAAAFSASLKGAQVMKCTEVAAQVSKKGTSMSLKTKKN